MHDSCSAFSERCEAQVCALTVPQSLLPPASPPGPRSWTFSEGERKAAFEAMLDASDVVCMTEEEAEAVTGLRGAEAQARWVLGRPAARTEWCVVKRGAQGAVLASRSCGADAPVYRQQALRVDVRDTGGRAGRGGGQGVGSTRGDAEGGGGGQSCSSLQTFCRQIACFGSTAMRKCSCTPADVRLILAVPAHLHGPSAPAVGCGDSFAAAVVLGFTRGHSIPAVMALASAVGAATAMGQGAGRNVASADTVLALLQSAVPGCEDGRHRDALEVLHCSLSSMDSS